MVNLDKIDLDIIKSFYGLLERKKGFTTSELAKKVFGDLKGYDLITKTNFINRRLIKLSKYGLVKIDREGKYYYLLDRKKCQKSLMLNIKGGWHMFPFD